ncbi:MAG: hypothetical protein H6Q86_3588 [candidate division NC10 bacterium]|jgi:acyl-CoA hydrolase|nr:hypothetical protein [candidate division NC10 bacterium]MBP2672168.1 hypothetical protein [candidate division NC10 bacterium]
MARRLGARVRAARQVATIRSQALVAGPHGLTAIQDRRSFARAVSVGCAIQVKALTAKARGTSVLTRTKRGHRLWLRCLTAGG